MKVKMIEGMAGARYSYSPGAIVDVSTKVGKEWIAAGIACKTNAIEEKEKAANHASNDAELKPSKKEE